MLLSGLVLLDDVDDDDDDDDDEAIKSIGSQRAIVLRPHRASIRIIVLKRPIRSAI